MTLCMALRIALEVAALVVVGLILVEAAYRTTYSPEERRRRNLGLSAQRVARRDRDAWRRAREGA